MFVLETTVESATAYLGATSEERLNPSLLQFIDRAADRIARRVHRDGPISIEIALLVESWLVANQNEQPLWPKAYDDNTNGNDHTTGRAFYLTGGSTRPDWMKRRWV